MGTCASGTSCARITASCSATSRSRTATSPTRPRAAGRVTHSLTPRRSEWTTRTSTCPLRTGAGRRGCSRWAMGAAGRCTCTGSSRRGHPPCGRSRSPRSSA
ncbi:hypothetical protein C5C13_13460 [Clavibacter michiganensis]|nr:hypothetical protein C5C13_13460 [Clavibacter michiganensis]